MSDSAENSQLPPDELEFASRADSNLAPKMELEKTTNVLIRKIVVSQRQEDRRNALPDLGLGHVAEDIASDKERVRHSRLKIKTQAADGAHLLTQKTRRLPMLNIAKRLVAGLTSASSYRPSRSHAFIALVAVVMFLRPWLIPMMLFVTFLTLLISYFTLGPDRVAVLVVGGWKRLHKHRPELAETLRKRAEKMAQHIDHFLDNLPGSWSDQIHVPDLSPDQDIAAGRPDPFDRLINEARQG